MALRQLTELLAYYQEHAPSAVTFRLMGQEMREETEGKMHGGSTQSG
jgi:hypothetical protein